MKKYIWGFVFVCIVNTTIAKPTRLIDLNLAGKHPITDIYEWVSLQAIKYANIKKKALIKFLGFEDTREWEEFRSNTKRPNRFHPDWYKKEVMPAWLKNCIYNVLTYYKVQTCLNIIDIITKHPSSSSGQVKRIIVRTENFGTIEFRASQICSGVSHIDYNNHYNCGEVTMKNNTHIIFLDPIKIQKLKLTNETIEAWIGHELGHVIHDDNFNEYLALEFYEQETGKNNLESLPLFIDYVKACEVAADIVGTFGNPKWIKGWITFFKKLDAKVEFEKNSTHPTLKERLEYLQEIYKAF